jgi:hypothetical protein
MPGFQMKNSKSLAALLTLASLLIGGCEDGTGPRWAYGGKYVARVLEVRLPDTIRVSETLWVGLDAVLENPMGRPTFSHLEIQRTGAVLDLTVWADVDLWVGQGSMPPTSLTVLWDHSHREPPPFPEGTFTVLVRQPTGAPITRTIQVIAN